MNLNKRLQYEGIASPYIVFGYTPFCGTCKLAEKMLDITSAAKQVQVKKIDLNYYEDISQHFCIQSVPVMLFVKDGIVKDISYQFESVTTLYENINLLLTKY
ncbi:thioredoxin family protein [Macrococcus capreoli]|uniref:thioredoxin family protein n=1 Tax=Macrococcus capreoli TaxID=2982690 RepID=UPI0021D5911F|nr:thioredoxin family protein [Macrococcus sp. TMW 2.2395]MCU7556346.1 thioredoxin family protein [Macrococcus sp. TMW 2.2395]